ncbi:MAG: alpha/beta hydrolase [Cyanothece sp. SIO1E1]|nr:alpha/beta hydrolase [Cyanothece sp. SIO1E1]
MNPYLFFRLYFLASILSVFGLTSCLDATFEFEECNTKTHLHIDPISARSQALISGAKLANYNEYDNWLDQGPEDTDFPDVPNDIQKRYLFSTETVQNRQVLTMAPSSGATGKYFLFIHGGGYVLNMNEDYFRVIGKIIDKTGISFLIPDYGLAPNFNYTHGYELIQEVYEHLVVEVGSSNVIVGGDSAGGGFSLGFVQKQRNDGNELPARLILFYPWLDLSLTNPDIDKIDDVISNRQTLIEAGLSWSGGSNPDFYQLSPINGTFNDLSPVSLFIGGRDMFFPDAAKLRKIMTDNCYELEFYEYPQMFHGWAFANGLPETDKLIEEVTDIINDM